MKKLSNFKEFRLLAKELQCVFSANFLTHLAKETQFVQRTSKFRAQDLAALCIGMGQDIASYSLTRPKPSDITCKRHVGKSPGCNVQ
ncbi:hypothetical protein [Bacillus cereus]|uniref:hypothetical protein n=1 Tax=Bacillus cereus TaxID=1396 RepID=UPI000950E381|nr:hypothetical protein [Bacillus cereus]OLR23794.1 hypothetical protein BLD50_20940 [Bacillus cereus]